MIGFRRTGNPAPRAGSRSLRTLAAYSQSTGYTRFSPASPFSSTSSSSPNWMSPALSCNWATVGSLRPQDLPPGQHALHQGPHAQFAGDSQGLIQQGDGLGPVSFAVPLTEGIGVVAAGPCQLGPVACLAAEGQGVFKVWAALSRLPVVWARRSSRRSPETRPVSDAYSEQKCGSRRKLTAGCGADRRLR